MPSILVIYGTTDGHTAKVAAFLGEHLRALGHTVEVDDAKEPRRSPMAADFDAVIVAASIHVSGYQQAVRRWVRDNLPALGERPNAFLSVCMGIVQATPRVRADLDAIVERFVAHTGWRPQRIEFVAGAIPYSRYGLFKRWVMQYMSRQAGVKTSPKQDYEYTDWEALRGFAVDFSGTIPAER
jgi:menaquinone-dependent protoporphyrinogen oxidase